MLLDENNLPDRPAQLLDYALQDLHEANANKYSKENRGFVLAQAYSLDQLIPHRKARNSNALTKNRL